MIETITEIEHEGTITIPFKIAGWPTVRGADGETAIFAESARAHVALGGDVVRIEVWGATVVGSADGPQRVWFQGSELTGAGEIVQALRNRARVVWEREVRDGLGLGQAHEQRRLHEAILEVLDTRGSQTTNDLLALVRQLPGDHGVPSATTVQRALNLMQERGLVASRAEQRGSGKPNVWRLA